MGEQVVGAGDADIRHHRRDQKEAVLYRYAPVIMNTDAETPPLAAGRSVVSLFSNKSSGMMQYPQFTDRYTFAQIKYNRSTVVVCSNCNIGMLIIHYLCSRLNWVTLSANRDTPFTHLFTVKNAQVLFSVSRF